MFCNRCLKEEVKWAGYPPLCLFRSCPIKRVLGHFSACSIYYYLLFNVNVALLLFTLQRDSMISGHLYDKGIFFSSAALSPVLQHAPCALNRACLRTCWRRMLIALRDVYDWQVCLCAHKYFLFVSSREEQAPCGYYSTVSHSEAFWHSILICRCAPGVLGDLPTKSLHWLQTCF